MAKVDLFPDFRELLKSFNSARVKYLLIGGYAVVHYAYQRTTDDLDLWIEISEKNASRISKVLQEWGGFAADEVPPSKFLAKRALIIFGREPVRVDLLTYATGLNFHECYARRNVVLMDGVRVPLISLKDLKTNKQISGRHKDLADLVYLKDIKHSTATEGKSTSKRKKK